MRTLKATNQEESDNFYDSYIRDHLKGVLSELGELNDLFKKGDFIRKDFFLSSSERKILSSIIKSKTPTKSARSFYSELSDLRSRLAKALHDTDLFWDSVFAEKVEECQSSLGYVIVVCNEV